MERYKKNIEKTVAKWQTVMDLGFVTVHNFFSDEEVEQTAEVITSWEYREAAIVWYNKNCKDLTQEELDHTAVHELSHIIVAPMSDHLPVKHQKLEEFVCESIARALIKLSKQ